MTEIGRFQIEAARWSDAVFGVCRKPDGPIAHLKKEVGELADHPYDDMEYADCLMLVLDAAHCAGIPVDDLLATCWEKLEINRQRDWGEPDADGAVEHIRSPWISKDDHLPPPHEDFIALNSDGRIFGSRMCYGMHAPFFTYPPGDKTASDTAPGWIDVTHWMPEPELP